MNILKTGIALSLCISILPACGKKSKKDRAPKVPDFPQYYGADWYNESAEKGGINVDLAYAEGTFTHDVIVAVIDSGISVSHEDLRQQLWINTKEIPNNNIDDDENGYVDDINGWNYMVDKDGKQIDRETFEVTREYRRLKNLQSQRALDEKELSYFQEVEADYNKGKEMKPNSLAYNLDYQPRADDLDDFTLIDRNNLAYGNNVIDDLSDHGSHVSGIIAADRTNALGIRGVAERARIMTLRAIPNGDEHDKDIFHAIRYAVDNGARIINMSFGKSFSRHPEKVMEAFQYAQEHNVLIVHAVGNAGINLDEAQHYPSRSIDSDRKLTEAWLEVGAVKWNTNFVKANFSNFGKLTVDIFAPGVDIRSCARYGYTAFSGTSMAAPVVSGTAAMILSAFPELSAVELRRLIMESARKADLAGNELELRNQSVGGGVIDALALFRKAKELDAQR